MTTILEEMCIFCEHQIDLHKVKSSYFNKRLTYSIICHNDDELEGGYYHCSCNMGFPPKEYKWDIKEVNESK